MAAKPFEELDEAARKGGDGKGSNAAKQAAMTALAGAVAAGLAGAAKAMLDRRGEDGSDEADAADADEPKNRDEQQAHEPDDADDEQPEAAEESDDEPRAEEDAGEEDEDAPDPQAQSDEPEREESQEPEPVEGVAGGEAKAVADRARQELQELLGVEPERVSGFERADGRWTVTVEVVDVKRIPESTDVLASYAVTLDDDRKLVSVSQTRRYRRSQVEEG